MNNIISQQSPIVVCAPDYFKIRTKHRLFLAGGITNCPDWQSNVIHQLNNIPDLTIFNPRRSVYPDDPQLEQEQITWEYKQLEQSSIILVWFSSATLNPITLYELGRWVNSRPNVPAFIGIDPGYKRTNDVIIQTKLSRPDINIVSSLDDLIDGIKSMLV